MAKPAPTASRHVALLRGINVGGKNRLPMAELVECFTSCSCSDVQTYIQSGNVILRAPASRLRTLDRAIADCIEARFGFRVPVILRSAEAMRRTLDRNPFLARGDAPDLLHVAFLRETPPPERVAALDTRRFAPDELAIVDDCVYLRLPSGVGKSKLTNAWLDASLATVSTLRNWRTVVTLCELAEA